jgi:endonuclease/exonuclease/phosphatase (EEP) superfamily protein YafD
VVVTTSAILLIVATLIPLISTNWWLLRIFTFPQAQITILLVIVAIAALLLLDLGKSWPKLLLASLAAATIYQLQYLAAYSPLVRTEVAAAQDCPAERRVRILVLNVLYSNSQYQRTVELVRRVKPDLFLAMETDFRWARALRQLTSQMPNLVAEPRDGPWGMMLFSRLPLNNARVSHLVEDYVPSIRAWVELPSGTGFAFHGVHPKPPLMHSSETGDTELILVGRKVQRSGEPSVVAGDLNDVPWSATTQRFQQVSGMADPRVGRAFLATFMTDNPLLRWPLDHVFTTDSFRLISLGTLDDVGSDHFPLLAVLCKVGPAERRTRSQD